MMKKLTDFFGDKRIAYIYVVVIVVLLSGITYALSPNSVALNITTGLVGIDEEYYGDTTFDSSDITLTPILDTEVETRLENVIKIDFTVGGASTNNASNIIYDIALVDFKIDCSLINEYFKWKLVDQETGEVIVQKNKDDQYENLGKDFTFDTIEDNRVVLTNTQLDLPVYSSTQTGYHNYSFYIWLSDSCQEDSIEDCTNPVDQNYLLGKMFSGKIEIELYTESKSPPRERNKITDTSYNSCIVDYEIERTLLSTASVGSYVSYAGNNGCTGDSCSGGSDGWRIAYIENNIVYLVSAGVVENNVTTLVNGTYDTSVSTVNHIANLNNKSLNYCNSKYSYNGVCNNTTTWSINANDYYKIIGAELSSGNMDGRTNDIIGLSYNYWFATNYSESNIFFWDSFNGWIDSIKSNAFYNEQYRNIGLRPIIKLDSTVFITGGTGTSDNPYQIANK